MSHPTPLDPDMLQTFLDALDQAGEALREVLDGDAEGDSPAIQFYLDGSAFLESGYLMVEQLGEKFPSVFRALHDDHYMPAFEKTRKGQISYGEALDTLPDFLKEYAQDKVHQDLLEDSAE